VGFEFWKMKLVFVERIIGVLPLSLSTRTIVMGISKELPNQRQLRLDYWRKNYGEQNVQRFLGLESALVESEGKLNEAMGPRASLKAYARHRIRSWAQSSAGVECEPDQIVVTSLHKFSVGGREVVQEDKRSLTEFVIFGLQISTLQQLDFSGTVFPGLTSSGLQRWLSSTDIRSDFTIMMTAGASAAINEAMQEHLARQIEFTLFCAKVERYSERLDDRWILRYLQGDPALFLRGVILPGSAATMKDLFVISEQGNPQGRNILYAPGAPDGKVWHSFDNVVAMGNTIGDWASKSPAFIDDQVSVRYRDSAHLFFRELAVNKRFWKDDDVKLREFISPKPGQPLFGVVSEQIRWDTIEAAELAPANYRNAPVFWREQFARLNTELKALYTVEARDHTFISYQQFAYDLIKYTLEQALKSQGEHSAVDPDLIMIEFSPSEKATLTSVIASEKVFYPVERENASPDLYPRYRLQPGHPSLKKLTIVHLAQWSRTLRPGEKYIAMLRSVYLDPTELSYAFRRDVHRQRQFAEMNRAALSEYFQQRMTFEQLNGLLNSIVSLKSSQTRDPLGDYPAMENSVYQFHLGRRRPVEGVYVFRLMNGKTNEDWLYTPQAPDGTWFRPLGHFVSSVRFKGLRAYYATRVHYTDRLAVSNYFDELEASTRSVPPPDLEHNSRVRDFARSYDDSVWRVIRDVDAQTTSLAEIITGLTYNAVIQAAQVISLVIPPLGLAVAAIQITKNILDGAQAYHDGNKDKAITHFKDALIDLASLGYGKYKEFGKQAVTATQKTLISLAGDAKTVAGLVSQAMGREVPHEVLKEIVEDVLSEIGVSSSKTTVR
jgi:hypothetical protein